jgi:uncharacterized protein YkwD
LLGQNGAQRASLPPRVARALVGATLAALIATPAAFATTPTTPTVPAAATATTPATTTATTSASAPWLVEEAFYLRLVNCNRTGGLVLSTGVCLGYGTGRYSPYVKPLVRSAGISDKVTRPYAKLIAIRAYCGHFLDHDPGYRLRRAGYNGTAWGENAACRDSTSSVHAAILWGQLQFQSERSYNGPHWKNIKNPRYSYIGIGVWKYGNRVRLVTDFWRP